LVLVFTGAVVSTFGGSAPTGIRLVDVAYVGLAGATLTLAGGRARRVSWLLSAVLVLWLAPSTPGRVAALLAVVVAVYAVRTGRRRALGAAVGALLAFALGDLGSGPFLGSTTIFALIAAAPMLGSAAWRMPTGWQRPIVLAISISGATAFLATLVFGLAGLLAIGDVGDGIDAANRGFELASDGEQDGAGNAFDAASTAFDDARGKVSGFWTLPARLVPIVGQHVRAVQVVAAEGVALTDAAGDTARSVDPDDLRLVDGGLDLDLVEDLEPVLERTVRALDRARDRVDDARSSWLVPPIDDRLVELLDELDDARPPARTAALAVREVPTMLGSDGPVFWLVAMTTPAEARGLGGLLGNWVLVEADEGRLDIVLSGRNEEVSTRLREREIELEGPEQYLARWSRFSPESFFQDVTLSPDLPMVAEVTANLFEQAMDRSVDGVLFLDPFAVSAVLDLSGPIVAGDRRLTDATVVPFLLIDQYIDYENDEVGRILALNELVQGAFEAFTSGTLPGPRAIADVLGPMVEQDRIGAWWQTGGEPETLIEDTGLDGRFPDAADGDILALVHQNAGQNKLDSFLRREVDYRLRVADGEARATITVTLRNELTDLSLPDSIIGSNDQGYPLGTNVARLTVHTGFDLSTARLDGEPFLVERETAFGHDAITATVEIPAGATRILEIDVAGPTDAGADDYRLTIPFQPLVNDDTLRFDVEIDGTVVALPSPLVLTADMVIGPGANS
jgi:Protein of unknown function (DUF4012)